MMSPGLIKEVRSSGFAFPKDPCKSIISTQRGLKNVTFWRQTAKLCIHSSDQRRNDRWEERREEKRYGARVAAKLDAIICPTCNKICFSHIDLYSHSSHTLPLSPETDRCQQQQSAGMSFD
ncbi:Hypothetical predicted protein [Podarcis lilfordi]|uniref:Uncharacterized protein n=1 Tax=Podarcis lilfordi TaxID=74358 RepID=A0AA35KXY8_9SAUR|nr:Hypothetical predicted protein [Podarcis lilfordi]